MPAFKPFQKRKPKARLETWVAGKVIEKVTKKAKEMKFPEKLKSRKLWVAVVGAAVAAFGTGMGFSEDVVTKIIAVLSAYLLGNGLAARPANFRAVKPEVLAD